MSVLASIDWPGLFWPSLSLVEVVIRGTAVYLTLLESDGKISVIKIESATAQNSNR